MKGLTHGEASAHGLRAPGRGPWGGGALIVTAILGVIAAVMAISGKKQVDQATPPTPEQTIEDVEAEVAEIKESAHR